MKHLSKNSTPLLVIGVVVLLASCRENDFPAPNRCGQAGVVVKESSNYSLLFGNGINQLSAGDISGSLNVTGNIKLWFVNNDSLNTAAGPRYLHNCILLQDGNSVEVKYDNSGGSLLPEPGSNTWYTINNGIAYNGKYELIASLWEKTGSGAYDYVQKMVKVFTIDAGSFMIENEYTVLSSSDIVMGSCILQEDGYTYIYGSRNHELTKDAFIARIPAGSVARPWEFYDGYTWTPAPVLQAPVLSNVSDFYSVFREGGRLYMVSQAALFGEEVNLYRSDSPEKGWQFNKILYCRSGVKDGFLSANTLVHAITDKGNLICSYSLIDGTLLSTRPGKPVFIEISNWKQ